MKRYIKSNIITDKDYIVVTDSDLEKEISDMGKQLSTDLTKMSYDYLDTMKFDEDIVVDVDMHIDYDERFDDSCNFSFGIKLEPVNHSMDAVLYLDDNINYNRFCKVVNSFLRSREFKVNYPCEHVESSNTEFFCECSFEV